MKTILLVIAGVILGIMSLWLWQAIVSRGAAMTRDAAMTQTIKDYEQAEREALRKVLELREWSFSEIAVPGHETDDSIWKVDIATVKRCADDLRSRIDALVLQLRYERGRTAEWPVLEGCCQLRAAMDTAYSRMRAVHNGLDSTIVEEQLRGSRYAYNFGKVNDWCQINFARGTERKVAIANLLRIKWDITGIEAFHIEKMYHRRRAGCHMEFEPVEAVAIPWNDNMLPGQRSGASIFMHIMNWAEETNRKVEEVLVNGTSVPVRRGTGYYEFTAGKPGLREFRGVYKVRAPNGCIEPFSFRFDVMVREPKVCVKLDGGVTWFDAGVAVPFKVDILYAAPQIVVVQASRGVLTGKAGNYSLKVDTAGEVLLKVQYRVGDKLMPADSFRYLVR